jgi:hypothetical protein
VKASKRLDVWDGDVHIRAVVSVDIPKRATQITAREFREMAGRLVQHVAFALGDYGDVKVARVRAGGSTANR